MIVVSGFKIYPNAVKDCLPAHPGVWEGAAIGVPDEARGEAVKAFILPRGLSVTGAEVRQHCRSILIADKIPGHGVFRGDLRKLNVGSVLRTELRVPPLAELAGESA
jgi:long-chain acyl-CoA synthetase